MFGLGILLVIGLVALVAAVVRRARGRTAPHPGALRRVALGFALGVTFFFGLFIAGEALSDPGGLEGIALVASWLVPFGGLVALAWYRPAPASWVLGALTAVVVIAGAWYALAPDAWRRFEDSHGPIRAVAAFVLLAPLALLAWKRPIVGATLLLVVGIVPGLLAIAATGGGGAGSAVAIVSSPLAVVGLLFLVAGRIHLRSPIRG